MVDKKLINMVKKLHEVREKKTILEHGVELVNKESDELQTKIVDLMESLGITHIDVDGVGNCFLTKTIYPKVVNEEVLFKYLRSHGASDIIKYSVHPQTLKAYVKEVMEVKNEVPLGLEIFPKTKVSIRKE